MVTSQALAQVFLSNQVKREIKRFQGAQFAHFKPLPYQNQLIYIFQNVTYCGLTINLALIPVMQTLSLYPNFGKVICLYKEIRENMKISYVIPGVWCTQLLVSKILKSPCLWLNFHGKNSRTIQQFSQFSEFL